MTKVTVQRHVRGDDQGATLILVLIFTLVTSLTVAGLFTALRNDLSNSTNFASARSLQYDASTAIDLAIQSIRYTPLLGTGETLNASPPQPCWAAGTGGTYGAPSTNKTPDGVDIAVWCSTAWFPTSASTRAVTITACQAAISNSGCVADPVLQTVVTFDDYPAGGSEPNDGQCVVYCGSGLTIESWLQFPTVPTVSGLSSTSGSVSGGGTITITGSGLAQHSTINFVEESGGTPSSNNAVISASNNGTCSSTSCTATIPAVTTAGDYFVTVTTPEGTSADSQSLVYNFQAGTPVITGVTSTSGSLGGPSTGGTFVTISGSNFVVGDIVSFVQESGGQPVSGGATVGATSVTVSRTGADTVVITALAPNITSASPDTYLVTVTSPSNGTATNCSSSATNCNNVFTYVEVVPTVNTVSPASGPSGAAITIVGSGFISGATVSFTPESNGQTDGSPLSATNVTVSASGDELTADAPTLQNGTTYFVTVANQGVAGQSSYFPVFTAT